MKKAASIWPYRLSPVLVLGIFLLCVCADLFARFYADDFFQLLLLKHDALLQRHDDSLFGLFSFISNDAAQRQQLLQLGVLPWFAADDFYFRFWRPVAELSHYVDFLLAPEQAWFAHAHNIVWFLLLAAAFYSLMSRLLHHRTIVYLAWVVFVFNGRHVATIAWVANRHALIAAFFVCLALIAFVQYQQQEKKRYLAWSVLAYAVALLSAEVSVVLLAWIVAYQLILAEGHWQKKLAVCLPYGLLSLIWLAVYHGLSFGIGAAGGLYLSPFHLNGDFILALIERLPIYFASALLPMPAGFSWQSAALNPYFPDVILAFSGLFMALSVVLLWPELRRNRVLWFCFVAMLLAFVPLCASLPQDRLTILPSLFSAPFLAILLTQFIFGLSLTTARRRIVTALLIIHLLLSPLHLLAGSFYMNWASRQIEQNALHFVPDGALTDKQLIVLQMPIGQAVSLMGIRRAHGKDIAEQMLWLASDEQPLRISQVDNHTLQVDKPSGFASGFEAAFGHQRFVVGQTITIGKVLISIKKFNTEQRVSRIDVRFNQPLNSPNLLFYHWHDGRLLKQEMSQ